MATDRLFRMIIDKDKKLLNQIIILHLQYLKWCANHSILI